MKHVHVYVICVSWWPIATELDCYVRNVYNMDYFTGYDSILAILELYLWYWLFHWVWSNCKIVPEPEINLYACSKTSWNFPLNLLKFDEYTGASEVTLKDTVIMMTSSNGNIFRVTGPLREEFTGHRWIPIKKARDAELWCFLWSAPGQTVELTIETPVIWDTIALIMTSLWWCKLNITYQAHSHPSSTRYNW